jgi:hypothetical protein
MNDSQLNELFKNDELHCSPDPAVKSRLDYTFMLKESQGKIRQNSFTGLFTWIFSVKNIPVAATLFMAVLLLSVFNSQQKGGNFDIPGNDTASIQMMPLNIDSIIDQPFDDDTVVSHDLSSLKKVFPDLNSTILVRPVQELTFCKLMLPKISMEQINRDFRKTDGTEQIIVQPFYLNYSRNRIA